MTNKEIEQKLAIARSEIHDLKNHADQLFGHILGLAACFAASDATFSRSDAEALLNSLAGVEEVPENVQECAENTIGHVLNARSQLTK